ncbi:hypothetical protein [Aquabacter spiritensis]|uniref:Uncharacterized protein n=1 Tax=Aquabacter spiritensis TaxID=933073 RepID=A0A4R3LWZ4_9HYPH|nr:hypothetical protein [Aquabacter spiritensis]TCT04309.1 hypothetical protein EDC64_107126 [Aquabacter spiritensis]
MFRETAMRLALALAALVLSGGLAAAADPVFPKGSTVGLVPPVGMVESHAFSGFQDAATQSSILIVEMPPQAYEQVAAGFTDAALATKGITVESRGTLALGDPALKDAKTLLVTGRQQAGSLAARKWVLLAGTDQATALVTIQVPVGTGDALTDEKVRETLATLAFRPPPSAEDLLATLPFRLGDRSGFRLVKVVGNSAAILTDGPKDVIDGAEQPIFVAGVAAGNPREDDRRQFALRALSSVPGVKDMRIERAEAMRIAGQPGFEILADGKDMGGQDDVKIVQWLRFGQNAHLRMVAIVKTGDFPEIYPRLRAIRDGVTTN